MDLCIKFQHFQNCALSRYAINLNGQTNFTFVRQSRQNKNMRSLETWTKILYIFSFQNHLDALDNRNPVEPDRYNYTPRTKSQPKRFRLFLWKNSLQYNPHQNLNTWHFEAFGSPERVQCTYTPSKTSKTEKYDNNSSNRVHSRCGVEKYTNEIPCDFLNAMRCLLNKDAYKRIPVTMWERARSYEPQGSERHMQANERTSIKGDEHLTHAFILSHDTSFLSEIHTHTLRLKICGKFDPSSGNQYQTRRMCLKQVKNTLRLPHKRLSKEGGRRCCG